MAVDRSANHRIGVDDPAWLGAAAPRLPGDDRPVRVVHINTIAGNNTFDQSNTSKDTYVNSDLCTAPTT